MKTKYWQIFKSVLKGKLELFLSKPFKLISFRCMTPFIGAMV